MHFYVQPEAIAHLVMVRFCCCRSNKGHLLCGAAAVAASARAAELGGDYKFPTLASSKRQVTKLPV